MTIETVLDALLFWYDENGATAWMIDNPLSSFAPWKVDAPEKIEQYLRDLYTRSTTMSDMLDRMAQAGPIRIGQTRPNYSPGEGFFVPEQRNPDNTLKSDSYLLIHPDPKVYAFNDTGSLFRMNEKLILAHELGHWGARIKDTENDGDGNITDCPSSDNLRLLAV